MLSFDIRSLTEHAVTVDDTLSVEDPVWLEGDAVPSAPIRMSSFAGGSTRIGSGQGTAGKTLGPPRPSFSALTTFSGVIGVSSTQTPSAS